MVEDLHSAARLPLHFDVLSHSLPAGDFCTAIDSFSTTIADFNKRLFGDALVIEYRVLPTEDGSLKAITEITIKGFKRGLTFTITVGGLLAFLSLPDAAFVKGLYKGYTHKELNVEASGEAVGEFIRNLVAAWYSTPSEALDRQVPNELNLDKARKAKSQFYVMCSGNPEIRAVGFDDRETFPIQRKDFPHYISKDRVRPLPPKYRVAEAIIVSPVDTPKDSKWELQDVLTGTTIKAFMRDEAFKKGFLEGKYPLKETEADDLLKVLIEYERQEVNGDEVIREVSIKTVYSYNDMELGALPSHLELTQMVASADERPMDSLWSEKPND